MSLKDGPPWHTGPEIQIQDNVDGHDPQKAGWLYQLYNPRPRNGPERGPRRLDTPGRPVEPAIHPDHQDRAKCA